MATIFAHALVPLAMRATAGGETISKPLLVAACLASILPDADVISFSYGIPYADILGHRGFTHSIGFASGVGLLGAMFSQTLRAGRMGAFTVVALSTLSHPLLDAMTNGGLGVALFWPISEARFFLPWQPIEVSPIGISRFLSPRGAEVLLSEAIWLGVPLALFSTLTLALRRFRSAGG